MQMPEVMVLQRFTEHRNEAILLDGVVARKVFFEKLARHGGIQDSGVRIQESENWFNEAILHGVA